MKVASMEGQILYQVLAPENSLVEISHLAAQVAEVPIAFVTYIDADYHWLKAQVGIDQNPKLYVDFVKLVLSLPEYQVWGSDDGELESTPLFNGNNNHHHPLTTLAISADHVVGKLLKISDVAQHKKLQQHPLVKKPKPIRFYLAIPIVTQGQRIGILSLMDYRERPADIPVTPSCELALQRIANQISSQIGLHHKLIDLAMQLIKIQEKGKEQKQVAETLNLLQRAIAASKNGIIITDATRPDNTIIYCNAAFEKITGYSQSDVLNRNCRFLQGPDTDPKAIAKIRQAVKEEKDCLVVLKNYRRDGTPFWNELVISPVRDQHQRLTNFIGIQTDITQRKQAEDALQESEERYRLLANHSTDLISRQTASGVYLYVSPASRYLLGYEPVELVGKSILEILHPEDRHTVDWPTELLKQSARKNGHVNSSPMQNGYTFTHRLKHQNGNYVWFETTGQILKKDNQPDTGELVMVSRDITQRKETEALLLERSRLSMVEAEVGLALGQGGEAADVLQRCTDSMVRELQILAGGIWTMQQQTRHLKLLSFSSKKEISLADLQLDEAGNEENQTSPYYNMDHPLIVEGQVVGIFRVWSEEVISHNSRDVLTNVANAIALFIHRQQNQEQLSSHRENLLFKIANQIRDSLDLDKILGTAVTEIRNLLDIDQCYFIWCLAAHTTSIIVTHESRRNNNTPPAGEYPQNQINEIAEKIKNRQILRLDHTVIADQLVSQSLIDYFQTTGIKSQLLLPLQTRSAQLGAVVCCNYTTERAWNESEVELLQAVVDQIAIAIDQAELYAQTRAAALAAQTQAMQLNEALQNLQQKESQLIQQEKMSSLGQMVAGVAHEINNPVNFIYGNLSYCKDYFQDLLDLVELYRKNYPEAVEEIEEKTDEIELDFLVEDLPKILSSMEIGTERIRQIVLSLRNFSRLDEAEMKPVDIHEGIDSTLLILHNKIKPKGKDIGLEIIKNYGNLPKVECYAGQLNQVFMNVISNAIDALENTPDAKITITTELGDGNCPSTPTALADAKSVVIKIKDNGPGMPEKVRTHLFDPFFTTKPVGKGTGLGLSISYQIVVDKHGGSFQCLSEPGQGAEFVIAIPIKPSGHHQNS
jgi:PAS domain S-box-containing protein